MPFGQTGAKKRTNKELIRQASIFFFLSFLIFFYLGFHRFINSPSEIMAVEWDSRQSAERFRRTKKKLSFNMGRLKRKEKTQIDWWWSNKNSLCLQTLKRIATLLQRERFSVEKCELRVSVTTGADGSQRPTDEGTGSLKWITDWKRGGRKIIFKGRGFVLLAFVPGTWSDRVREPPETFCFLCRFISAWVTDCCTYPIKKGKRTIPEHTALAGPAVRDMRDAPILLYRCKRHPNCARSEELLAPRRLQSQTTQQGIKDELKKMWWCTMEAASLASGLDFLVVTTNVFTLEPVRRSFTYL